VSISSQTAPRHRQDVEIQKISESECVVKLRNDRQYFSLGPQEAYLLRQLNGRRSSRRIREKYEETFGESLSRSDFNEFITAVDAIGLLESQESDDNAKDSGTESPAAGLTSGDGSGQSTSSSASRPSKKKSGGLFGQSVMFFRIPLYDPDQFFNWLEPKIRWVWTRAFAASAVAAMLIALIVSFANSGELLAAYPDLMTWESALFFAVIVLSATILHEMAHGLTCKHFGGEVHETGLLFMFFIPCMFCNVSDAWLLPEKKKRLLITLAGGFVDLCIWAIAVFTWRLTLPGVLVNQIALIVLTVTGGRSFLNFNPLLRLDGYYLMADWLSIPNLRTRGLQHWMSHLRWMLWGAAKPQPIAQGRTLLSYGVAVWIFSIGLLNLILMKFFQFLSTEFGAVGLFVIALFLMFGLRRVFKGLFQSELTTMFKNRPRRTAVWAAGVATALILLFGIPVRSISSGDFEVRPGRVVQQHVAVTGIVDRLFVKDGDVVAKGDLIAEMHSPDLASQIRTTEDMLREVEASLQRLEAGTRPEEILAQKQHIARLETWRDLGKDDLEKAKLTHQQDLLIQEHQIREADATLVFYRQSFERSQRLYKQGALAGVQLRSEQMQLMSAESAVVTANAVLTTLKVNNTRSEQGELTSREQSLAEARQNLELTLAGSRPEDITAERAKRERIAHELEYLQDQKLRLRIVASTDGILSATRLREMIGQVVPKDSIFCTIEDHQQSWVEISVAEQDAALVKSGLPVTLKARAIPFETFDAKVNGIAPAAVSTVGAAQNVVVIHCQIEDPDGRLKSGMTGFGRIHRGWQTMGMIMTSRAMKYFRTEFWW
jgi:putative peptide zinc metalloprotease protein